MALVPGRRRARCASAVWLGAVALLLALLAAPVGASVATRVPGLQLVAQNDDVVGEGTFSFAVSVGAGTDTSHLGIQATLYSALPNRTYFDYTLNNAELPSESCLSETAAMPLGAVDVGGTASFDLPVSYDAAPSRCVVASSSLFLNCTPSTGNCDGVYPLHIALINIDSGAILRSFTTHLVELAPGRAEHRLQVALVLPLGSSVALAPNGRSTLTTHQITRLAADVAAIAAQPHARVSLPIYSQLLLSLSRSGKTGKSVMRQIDQLVRSRWAVHTLEPLDSPFANVDPSALDAAGLGKTLTDELNLGNAELTTNLGHLPAPDPFLVPSRLSTGGDALLDDACIHELVLPPGSVGVTALTQTAPVIVAPAKDCPNQVESSEVATEAFVADPVGQLLQASGSSTVLAAHQFLAELAQIYFERPNEAPRAVVAVSTSAPDPGLLAIVLEGLSSSPILQSSTVGSLFSTVPVGIDGNLAGPLDLPASPSETLPQQAIASAGAAFRSISSMVPPTTAGNRSLLAGVQQSIELGESSGVTAGERSSYLGAATAKLRQIGSTLSFLGSTHFTLTAQSGRIPITIHESASYGPLEVDVRLSSSELLFPDGSSYEITLSEKDTALPNARVQTQGRSSHLYVEVRTPVGNQLLLRGIFDVRSTAVSGVAVGISIAALAVLGGWWLRSVRRRRRSRREPAPVQ